MSTTDDDTAGGDIAIDFNDDKSDDTCTFYPNRVFFNQLDSFHGKHFAKIIAGKTFRDAKEVPGEGEEGDEQEDDAPPSPPPDTYTYKQTYQVVGTTKKKTYQTTEDITLLIKEDDEEAFIKEIMKCGYVIYDITIDSGEIPKALRTIRTIQKKLEELKEEAPKAFATLNEKRVFVLISSVMTWAKTRPVDPEDPDVAFVESDFRKRKPHPNYKPYIDLEKEVIAQGKKNKDYFMTVVIATGCTYGEEEEDLHFLFKLAYKNKLDLPVIQPGHNTVPLIHVKDLISILYAVMENVPKKPKYILAVEQTSCTQKQIVKALCKVLGNERYRVLTKEESFLYPDMTQTFHERLSVNLKMEPNFIVADLNIKWQSNINFCDNIHKIVKEYIESRKLFPINVIMHGPPAVGKTTMGKRIAEYYGLHYISIKTLIEESLAALRTNIQYAQTQKQSKMEKEDTEVDEAEEAEPEEDEDWDGIIIDATVNLKSIERGLEESVNGKLPDHIIISMLRDKLNSNQCRNAGYVLDGYPKTSEQTRELFDISEGDEGGEEGAEEEGPGEEGVGDEEAKKNIFPHYVIALEATDAFLCNRVMQMPESQVQNTHYTEEHMVRRINEFRLNNTDENTLVNIFDEREIHPFVINAETDNPDEIFSLIQSKIGEKFGYPPSDYEKEQMRLMEEEIENKRLEAERLVLEERERIAKKENEENMERWAELLQQVQHEEQQQLTAQCKPLREYLVRFVFPTLTRALLETARVKPDDPVDFLAEFLFKENPEGRMFDPAYVAAADDLFKTIQAFQKRLGE